jgi:hypothetical protein
MLGGLSWFAIPWAFGTVMGSFPPFTDLLSRLTASPPLGLTTRALSTSSAFPTYPYALSASQVSAGLVAPAAAQSVLGKGGCVAVLLIVRRRAPFLSPFSSLRFADVLPSS